jgi:diguanylate cyclase
MDTHEHTPISLGDRVRQWFGIGPDTDGDPGPDPDHFSDPRERLLHQVWRFLAEIDVDISAASLAIAHDCVSGVNPQLAMAVEKHRQDGGQFSLSWLEKAARSAGHDQQIANVTSLINQLSDGIEEFDRNTHSPREATHDYTKALRDHGDYLERTGLSEATIAEFLTIGRAMMSRTLQIETRLKKSEERTRELQKKLEETRRLAELDHLTKLPNRRAFERMYDREYTDARNRNDHLCVAFCDIDHFKAINDTHGHAAGDRVLRTIAGMLDAISSDTCHVARHGGEEFAMVFRGLTLAQSFAKLDEVRDELAKRQMVNRKSDMPFGRITFSAGIADALAWADRRAALKAADDALYAAKHAGRNRVIAAGRPPGRKAA